MAVMGRPPLSSLHPRWNAERVAEFQGLHGGKVATTSLKNGCLRRESTPSVFTIQSGPEQSSPSVTLESQDVWMTKTVHNVIDCLGIYMW